MHFTNIARIARDFSALATFSNLQLPGICWLSMRVLRHANSQKRCPYTTLAQKQETFCFCEHKTVLLYTKTTFTAKFGVAWCKTVSQWISTVCLECDCVCMSCVCGCWDWIVLWNKTELAVLPKTLCFYVCTKTLLLSSVRFVAELLSSAPH